MKIVQPRRHRPDRALFSGPQQRRQEEKLGVVRVSFKAQVTCISWHMCALRGNEKRSAWECKSKDAPQTERNAIDAQNEGAAGQRTKNNTRKSSGRGAHRADLLSAYRAWRKVVRATRPERVVLFAPPALPATTNSERSPTKPVTRPRPHVRTARVGPKGAHIMHNVRSTVCARLSLSLSLFGAPPQKDFEARPLKKSEGLRVRHGSGKWLALGQPGGVGRGQGFWVRHGRGRSLALGQATRWCATLRRALRGAARWCATL